MVNIGYQRDDERIIDYDLWRVDGLDSDLRGPQPDLVRGQYAVAIGAAQTFGRFVKHPYPELLSERIGFPVVNLGFSGAGPSFFLQRSHLLKGINDARFVIVQMMSGRSISNSRFEVQKNQGVVVDRGQPGSRPLFAETAYRSLLHEGTDDVAARLRAEIRWRYIQENLNLLAAIKPPKILLYFSVRPPAYKEHLKDLAGYWGGFPHFVNQGVIDALRPHASHYVECVTSAGLPQPLFDRNTGEPVEMWPEAQFPGVHLRSHNHYYPSPEMHAAAAEALEAAAKDLTAGTPPPKKATRARAGKRDVLAHLHIFNNAGSSLDALLAESFGDRFLAMDPASPKAVFTQADLYAMLAEHPSVAAIASHRLRAPMDDGPDVRLFPYFLLRDPIARLHSVYEYEASEARQATSTIPVTRWAKENDFRGFVEVCLRFDRTRGLVASFQTRALSAQADGGGMDWDRPMEEADLYFALTFMDRLPTVGVAEQFDRSIERLRASYGRVFPELHLARPMRVDGTRKNQSLEDGRRIVRDLLGQETYAKVLSANAFDLELYRVACERLGA